MNSILITGGTGHLGRKVAGVLTKKNFKVGILTTQTVPKNKENCIIYRTGNLIDNSGLKEATGNVDIIIHCASDPGNFQQADIAGTKNLLNAIDRRSIKHFVYISIVGVDKSSYPYYRAKLKVENLLSDSGIPYTIVRTTQFHYFILTMIQNLINETTGNNSVLKIPEGLKFQSVSTQEVAELLAVTSLESPKGLLPDFGGKEVLSFAEMAVCYLNEFQLDRQVQLEMTTDIRHQLFRSGVNLCPDNTFGRQTWKDFLRKIKQNGSV